MKIIRKCETFYFDEPLFFLLFEKAALTECESVYKPGCMSHRATFIDNDEYKNMYDLHVTRLGIMDMLTL